MMNDYNNIKSLLDKINTNNININIIKKNAKILSKIYYEMLNIWNSSNFNIVLNTNNDSNELQNIINMLKNSILYFYSEFSNFIDNVTKFAFFEYENVKFYYLYNNHNTFENDKNIIKKLIKEAITCSKYFNCSKQITIIWIPINTKRDFDYKSINDTTLEKSNNKFKAFTSSGYTYKGYSIITRYEEISKLMFHELMHNFDADGSNYYYEMSDILVKYKDIKKNNNYHYNYSIYESYTELIGNYINLIFFNIHKNKKISERDLINKIASQIVIELIFSYNTICNLLSLNGYNNYDEFVKNNFSFKGDICFFEYYFVKALLYNNFLITNIKSLKLKDYLKIYNDIMNIIKYKNNDNLLQEIYKNKIIITNFKYSLINS